MKASSDCNKIILSSEMIDAGLAVLENFEDRLAEGYLGPNLRETLVVQVLEAALAHVSASPTSEVLAR